MANIISLVRNGGEMVANVESLVEENRELRNVIEEQGALIVVVNEKLQKLQDAVEQVIDHVLDTKTKSFIGKKPEFLPKTIDEVTKFSEKEIREIIHRAANRQQKGYTRIYSKLSEITGIDIYKCGKTRIAKSHGLGFTNTGESYINMIFVKGIEKEAAAVALDIIRNK